MTIAVQELIDELVSVVARTGHFDRVNAHEPKNAPDSGLTAAVWANEIRPVPARSGLAATSVRIVFTMRLYVNMTSDPQDAIDPRIMLAADELMSDMSSAFTLGGLVANVDLLGMHGDPLMGIAGYLTQDGRIFRVFDIYVPLIFNDVWTQAP